MKNVVVERYDPRKESMVEEVTLRCGSFDVDAGTLVVYSGKDGADPCAVFAPGEWRSMTWL